MATSILAGVQEFLTPSFLSRVSSQTGESEAAVSKGFTAIVPTLLASIADRSGDTGFMSRLVSLATNAPTDTDYIAPPLRENPTIESGSGITGWLSNLWSGGSVSAITNAVARYSGVRASSASSLLSVGGPLVLGYLGRLMRSDNLDAPKLAQRLQSERGALAAAMPAGFNALLPSAATPTGDLRMSEDVARRDIPPAVRRERSASWLWPILLLALATAFLLWWTGRSRTPTPTQAVNTASRGIDTLGSSARALTRTLPGGIQLSVPAGGMEDRLISYLAAPTGNGTFNFDRLEFETGSATLTPRSRQQLVDVARILNAYPNARVQIAGYTDNTGDEAANMALSRGRAESVMNALRENGAAAANLSAQGFGSQNPVADNTTEEGRARNRRVTLTVTG
jgi:outer membrane protein OmpA-like peptidoglycan-associated protein